MTAEPEEDPAPGAGSRRPWLAGRAITARCMGLGMYADLPGTPQAVRQAREIVSQTLGEDHPSAHDATLIVSELVSNAIAHSRSGQPGGTLTIFVEMTRRPDEVRVQVRDAGGPEAPSVTTADPDSEHGRGLTIVTALATEWGTEANHAGRTTWCRLSASRRPAEAEAHLLEREAG